MEKVGLSDYRILNISGFVDGFVYEIWSSGYFDDPVEDFDG